MKIIIERKKHDNVIYLGEFKRSYMLEEFEKHIALDEVIEAINDYENYLNLNGHTLDDLEDWEKEKIKNMKQLKKGLYTLNCGDYSYFVEIV